MKDPKKTFGKNLKDIREFLDLSQKELSEKTGLTNVTISNIENGLRDPNFETIIKILNATGVKFERFLK